MKRLQQHGHVLMITVAMLLSLVAFAGVLQGGRFVFDDHTLIERNTDLRRGDIWWTAFARDYYATSELPGLSGYYRPFATLSHAVDARLWGPRATGHHVTNILLHALTCLVLGFALRALAAPRSVAWMVAMFFAVHPVHAESVAFISGRVDVLAGLGVLVALASAASQRQWASVALGLSAFYAFLSKESAVVLPLLLLLVWTVPRGSAESNPVGGGHNGRRTGKIVALSVAAFLALLMRKGALGAWLPRSALGDPEGTALLPVRSILFTLASTYAPKRALSLEPHPSEVGLVHVVVGLLVAVLLWLVAWRLHTSSRPLLRRALLASGITLLPIINLLPQETMLSERFLYLPTAFFLVPAGVLAVALWQRGPTWVPAATGGTAVVLFLLLGNSIWRARVWRDDVRLWKQAVEEEPNRAVNWDRLGLALTERGSFAPAREALARAVELDPDYFNAQLNLGVLLQSVNRPREAEQALRKALELRPRHVQAHLNLGLVLYELRDIEGAHQEFRTAVGIKPDYLRAIRLAGDTALRLRRLPEARVYFERARDLDPTDLETQRALLRLEASEARQPPP